jgi:dUTP pyrophosphatase
MAKKPAKTVKVLVLPHGRDLPLPRYQTADAAGLDLLAAVSADRPLKLKHGAVAMVPTGLILELPKGFEAQVRPRSGLAAKHGVTVLNAPGTIDADYRGEVQVLLINHGPKTVTLARGDRIAQMVIAPVTKVTLSEVTTVRATDRGTGGFGSTGVKAPKPKPNGTRVRAQPASFPRRPVKVRPRRER